MSVSNENSKTPPKEKDLAQTPWWFIHSIESFIGKEFDLDVCCLEETRKARSFYSLEYGRDALELMWSGLVWCNPPFSNIAPFIDHAVEQAEENHATTVMIIPNNPEVAYRRKLKEVSDTFIEMPFRLKFLRPDGEPFDGAPKFSCAVGIITPLGLKVPTRVIEHDFRVGFYGKKF